MLCIRQALENLTDKDLVTLGVNLHLWARPPREPRDQLLEQLVTHLHRGIQWELTGDSMPAEAHALLLALAIWPSVIAPQTEDLIHTAAHLYQQRVSEKAATTDSKLNASLTSTLGDLRNLGMAYWVPWRELRPSFALDSDESLSQEVINYAAHSGAWLHDGWAMPIGIAASLFPHYAPHLAKTAIAETEPETVRSDGPAALYDMVQLMHASRYKGLRLTLKGVLYKRDQALLADRFLVSDAWRAHYGFGGIQDETPLRLQWMLAWAENSGLIDTEDRVISLGFKAERWLALPPAEQLAEALRFWRTFIARAEPGLLLILAALMWAPSQNWVNLNTVVDWLSVWQRSILRNVAVYQYRASTTGTIGTALAALVYMGLLEVGSEGSEANPIAALTSLRSDKQQSPCRARLTDVGRQLMREFDAKLPFLPAQEPSFTVEPSFEVVVQPLVLPQKHWLLAQIADLTRADQAYVYTITQESVLRGLRSGWTCEQMLSFLSTGNAQTEPTDSEALPQNVTYSIRDWSSGYGKCTVMRIAVVQCESPEIADHLLTDGLLENTAIGRVSPTAVLIRDDVLDRVTELLEKAGLPPPAKPVYVTDAQVAQEHGMGLDDTHTASDTSDGTHHDCS